MLLTRVNLTGLPCFTSHISGQKGFERVLIRGIRGISGHKDFKCLYRRLLSKPLSGGYWLRSAFNGLHFAQRQKFPTVERLDVVYNHINGNIARSTACAILHMSKIRNEVWHKFVIFGKIYVAQYDGYRRAFRVKVKEWQNRQRR